MNAKATDYRLFASNGRYIRIATRLTFDDGDVIAFIDRLPKRVAIAQAREQRAMRIARDVIQMAQQ